MSRWWARWRVALRIARRDAARHKGRTTLVVAMVALPLLAGSLMATAIRSTTSTPQTTVASELGPSAQAVAERGPCSPMTQSPDGSGTGCPEGSVASAAIDAAALRSVLGVEAVAPLWDVGVDLVSASSALPSWSVFEADDADLYPQFVEAVTGRPPQSPGEVALSPATSRRLDVEIGSTFRLEQRGESVEVTVVGLLDPRSRYDVAALSGTTPETWRTSEARWFVLGSEPVTWDQVLAANQQGWEVLSRSVVLDPPPIEQLSPDVRPSSGVDRGTMGLVAAVLAMGVLELGLLVGPAFAIGAQRNARQLAVTAAAGAAPADLNRMVLATGLITGLLASLVGIGAGLLLGVGAYYVSNWFTDFGFPNLVLPSWELLAMVSIAVVLGLGAAWIPARAAARSDVVAALAGRRRDPHPTKGIARLGVALAVLGVLAMVLGAATRQPAALVAGIVVLEVGVVAMSGTIVVAVGRIAPRLGVAGRFAVRDGVRHRSRTAPAVAAVLAAVAAAAAGAVYLQGESTASRASWLALTESPGLVLQWSGEDLAGSEQAVTDALTQIENAVEVEAAVPVYAAWAAPEGSDVDAEPERTMGGVYEVSVYGVPDPELTCAEGVNSADPRCGGSESPSHATVSLSLPGTLVDDGTVMSAAGLDGWEGAADVLTDGGVVVEMFATWPDGTAHLIGRAPGLSDDPANAVVVPTHGSTWWIATYSTVLSPQAAEQIGLTPVVVGGLVTTAAELDQSEVDRLNSLVRDVSPYLTLTADRPRPEGVPIGLVLLAVACVVALAAVALAVGLAGADTRPDLATLAAVGAAPSVRRRVAAAQAGVIAGTGAVLGVLTGIPIGLVLSLWGRETSGYGDLWPLAVPWPVPVMAVVVPLVAMGCTWVVTRPRLPLVRRVAE